MIFNIRGTSGSGKSTVVRELMQEIEDFEEVSIENASLRAKRPFKVIGHKSKSKNLFIIGSYEPHRNAPGADSIRPFEKIEEYIRYWMVNYNIVFEGLICSSVFNRWLTLSQEIGPGNYIWCFMNTSLEECRRRLAERNNGKPLKEIDHLGRTYAVTVKHKQRLAETEETVVEIGNSQQFIELLKHKGIL